MIVFIVLLVLLGICSVLICLSGLIVGKRCDRMVYNSRFDIKENDICSLNERGDD